MMFLLSLLVIGLITLGTTTGRAALHHLVGQIIDWLSRLSPGRCLAFGLLALSALILVGLFEDEGLRLFLMAMPEVITWATAFDVIILADGLALLAIMSVRTRFKHVAQTLRLYAQPMVRLIARVSRPRSPRPPKPPRPSQPDDDAPWAHAFASGLVAA
jgi:hypothetical protein